MVALIVNERTMLSHAQIWAGVDALARRANLSPSGLARAAGLDATTFNKSKRVAPGGDKPRWPSTESVAKILEATGVSFTDFAALAIGEADLGRRVKLLGFAKAGDGGFFSADGFPSGDGWTDIMFPGGAGDGVYALEVSGDSMEPVYRSGDHIVVAPGREVRRGDRIVVQTRDGEVMAKELGRVTADAMELVSLNPAYPRRTVDMADVAWVARILWASQ